MALNRPTINVTFLPGGRSNWSGLGAALAHALEPNPNRSASFSEIGIHDGTIVVHDSQKRTTQQLDDVEFQVAWPSISRTFAANGQFTWRDQPVDASLTLSDFQAALTGRRPASSCGFHRSRSTWPSTALQATSRPSKWRAC